MKVGLVLGGGGARGFAHIGVLRALVEHDVSPIAIAGSSMGAIIGAFFAAGYTPDDMEDVVASIRYRDFISLGHREKGGLIGGARIEQILGKYLPETFTDLSIPLEVTTVDVQKGKLVIVRSGNLIKALRASSALPGIFSPVHYNGGVFADGGILNNLPVDIIRNMTLEPVIAVDVAAPPDRPLEFNQSTWPLQFHRSLTMEMIMKSFDIPQKVLTDVRLSLQPPELLIRPPLDAAFGVEDFLRSQEAITLGYDAAQNALSNWATLARP